MGKTRPEGSAAGGSPNAIPTPQEIESTSLPPAVRAAFKFIRDRGPLQCASCGERLYRLGSDLFLHRGPSIFIPMHVAASRLRNHLRRLAITRVGPITGDCYFVPYYRFSGTTPEGDDSFLVAAAGTGDERLERPFLPPADLKPYVQPASDAAGPSGEGKTPLHVLPVTRTPGEASARVEKVGWKCDQVLELIHYPFYLMHVEDSGRLEGAWVDAIEVKVIHHRLRLSPPLPGGRRTGLILGIPAAAAAAATIVSPGLWMPLSVLAWGVATPLAIQALMRNWRG